MAVTDCMRPRKRSVIIRISVFLIAKTRWNDPGSFIPRLSLPIVITYGNDECSVTMVVHNDLRSDITRIAESGWQAAQIGVRSAQYVGTEDY